MAKLCIEGVSKAFGEKQVLSDINLTAESGEFVALLGPSGCGKTTLLNTISGILRSDAGRVLVDGRDIGGLPVEKRNIGMVFQNYALFDHMSVGQNLAYGLKIRRESREEIRKKVSEALEMVRLPGTEKRKISSLSGGEQQRVALARAIILRPDILLLDEPLSALDKNIREQMQFEIKRIQKETGITTVFVTHDQGEALAMADKIAIMRGGEIVEEGKPQDIYVRPESYFAASFLGTNNLIRGTYDAAGRRMAAGELFLPLERRDFQDGQEVAAAIKEEYVHITKAGNGLSGVLTEKLFLGQLVRMKVSVAGHELKAVAMEKEARELLVGETVGVELENIQAFAVQ